MTNKNQIELIRHSTAHVLAAAVLEMFPEAKFGMGPAIENGFYYDFELPRTLIPEDLPLIEDKMREIIAANHPFERQEVSSRNAAEHFAKLGQDYKLEIIADLERDGEKTVSLYKTREFVDLCAGPHLDSTGEIDPKAFKLDRLSGAYWKGSEKNKQLQRIYGLAFASRKELAGYLQMMQEAEKRDHRKLGKDLDLFVFSDLVGKGLPLFTEKGALIKREIERFIQDEEIRRGYKHVCTPDLAKVDLYRKSGHYPYYKDSMYAPMKIDDEELILRPMTCPHHFELYRSRPRSYRELPMRIAELAKLYRYEQSGELTGLIRLRGFCLADAHIICRNAEQAGQEIQGALDLIEFAAKTFGLAAGQDYSYRLSLGNRQNEEKYFKDDAAWDTAEDVLRQVLQRSGAHFVEVPDEAAFYGPKIDIQMRNVRGKEETAFTVQYDFVMPKRFDLKFIDSDGQEKEVVVIHRSSIGAIERTMAFLIEHYAGAFPLWLSPVQAVVVPVSDKFSEYAQIVNAGLSAAGIRSGIRNESETLGKRIREAEQEKIPYILVVGEKEVSDKSVTVRKRGEKDQETCDLDAFAKKIRQESLDKK